MGFYINPPDGRRHNKAGWLVEQHGATLLPIGEAPTWQDDIGIVCVVNNGPFEAAAYAFDPQELEAFKGIANRPKIWLTMNKAVAACLSGYNPRE